MNLIRLQLHLKFNSYSYPKDPWKGPVLSVRYNEFRYKGSYISCLEVLEKIFTSIKAVISLYPSSI